MTDKIHVEIDGLKIIHREPGWEDEWKKVIDYLFEKHLKDLKKCSCSALSKFHSLQKVNNDLRDEFISFLLLYWNNQYAEPQYDENGALLPVESNYDPEQMKSSKRASKCEPKHPLFICYLLGSIYKCYLVSKFHEDHSSIAHQFKQKFKRRTRAKGKREGKSKEEIEKDENISFKNVYIQDNENSHTEWLSDTHDPQQEQSQKVIEDLSRQYICYLNDECKDLDKTHFLSCDNRQAGAQLYPEMIGSSLLDSPDVWFYSNQKQPVCNQKGIQWIIQKTLLVIEQNNPEQSPERMLYDIHQKASQETDCIRDFESEAAEDSITRNHAFNRQFAPIVDFGDLIRLFGITSEENARAERSRYTRSIAKWLNLNRKKFEAALDSIK